MSVQHLRRICVNSQGGVCWYCGDVLTSKTATLDHVVPKCRGGKTTLTNSVAACRLCNQRKGDSVAPEGMTRSDREVESLISSMPADLRRSLEGGDT